MRSLLFVPADSERKLAKGRTTAADALIVDLEDSVAPSRKADGRAMAAAFVASENNAAQQICVRINALQSPDWQSDLDAITETPPPYVMLPKARGGEDIKTLEAEIAKRGMTNTRLIVLITELPISLLRLDTYIPPPPSLEAYTWGAEDLSAELGAYANRDDAGNHTAPYALARSLCLYTAAAAERPAIDTVFTNFRDTAGLEREVKNAVRDGFTGKLAIHPAQVDIINTAFTPDDAQLARARAILAAFAEAGEDAQVVNFDGEMVDEPHRRQAARLIARAEQFGTG